MFEAEIRSEHQINMKPSNMMFSRGRRKPTIPCEFPYLCRSVVPVHDAFLLPARLWHRALLWGIVKNSPWRARRP